MEGLGSPSRMEPVEHTVGVVLHMALPHEAP